ncbi:MAG TPA: cytochrome c oxidase subunit 3 [Candidatus Thermoplasmatota archaeon]|nr:cytochrome c oxidase subunit 3 [Candidatus Thermoplasmatota archaeon]
MSSHQHDHAHGEAVHHELSAAPLLVGIGALITYFGVGSVNHYFFADAATGKQGVLLWPYITTIGVAVLLYAFWVWTKEDALSWAKRPAPAHGKDIGWHGMVYFLCTEVMLFGSLFFAYFYQMGTFQEVHFNIPLIAFNTALLMASGGTLHWGVHSIQKGNRNGLIWGLILTIILGAVFLGLQVYEYYILVTHDNFTLQSGAYGSIFYMLTGTHGFHVFLGLVFLAIVLARALYGNYSAEKHVSVEAFAIYWHFVDVVWIFLFIVVYLRVV